MALQDHLVICEEESWKMGVEEVKTLNPKLTDYLRDELSSRHSAGQAKKPASDGDTADAVRLSCKRRRGDFRFSARGFDGREAREGRGGSCGVAGCCLDVGLVKFRGWGRVLDLRVQGPAGSHEKGRKHLHPGQKLPAVT